MTNSDNILTTFSTPIYSSKISDYDIIQNELEGAYNQIDFTMNPHWGNTHYLSDPTFRENLIVKYQLENFYNEISNHLESYCEGIEFSIREYFILLPKASALFPGIVQGVVVQITMFAPSRSLSGAV